MLFCRVHMISARLHKVRISFEVIEMTLSVIHKKNHDKKNRAKFRWHYKIANNSCVSGAQDGGGGGE